MQMLRLIDGLSGGGSSETVDGNMIKKSMNAEVWSSKKLDIRCLPQMGEPEPCPQLHLHPLITPKPF